MGCDNDGTWAGAVTSWTVVMVELGQLPVTSKLSCVYGGTLAAVTSIDGSNGGTWAAAVTSMEGGNNASPSCSVTAPGRNTRAGTAEGC